MSFLFLSFYILYFKDHLTRDAAFCLFFKFFILHVALSLPPPPPAFHSLFPRDESVGHGEGGKSYGGEIPHGDPLHTPTNCEAGLKMRVGGGGRMVVHKSAGIGFYFVILAGERGEGGGVLRRRRRRLENKSAPAL